MDAHATSNPPLGDILARAAAYHAPASWSSNNLHVTRDLLCLKLGRQIFSSSIPNSVLHRTLLAATEKAMNEWPYL